MSIIHNKEIILREVNKLQRLNYNQFFWWRKFRSKQKELSKYAYAVDKIRNGDFDFSHYYWQAQYALLEMEEKTGHITHPSSRHEAQTLFRERHRRLMKDFEKDEPERLGGFYKECKRTLRLSKETVEEIATDFEGTLEELYIQLQEKYQNKPQPVPNFNNFGKKRGRPKKTTYE
jgi:hypothetical protein